MSSTVPPIAIPDPRHLAGRERPFVCCADCGFLAIQADRALRHVTGGIGHVACPRCQFRGAPVVLTDVNEYVLFVAELHDPR